MNQLKSLLIIKIQSIIPIVKKVVESGGSAFIVGGVVRDLLMNLNNSSQKVIHKNECFDLDIEVHGLSLQALENILSEFSWIVKTGQQFSVLKMPKYNIDWSLPRIDSFGRKPDILTNPFLSIKEALFRRDITINSIAINLVEVINNWEKIYLAKYDLNKIIKKKIIKLEDPFGGFLDIKNKIIRPTGEEKFIEDPLRLFRVMQFIPRFNLKTSLSMDLIARKMIIELKDKESNAFIAKERITEEFVKMLLKSQWPINGIFWLKKIGKLDKLSSILNRLPHETLQNISKSWAIINKKINENDDKLMFFFSIVLFFSKEKAHIFFRDFTVNKNLEKASASLCHIIKRGLFPATQEDLLLFVNDIYPCKLLDLIILGGACNIFRKKQIKFFLKFGKIENILSEPKLAIVTGSDLLEQFSQGPEIGNLLKKAYELQIKHRLKSKNKIIQMLLKNSPAE